MLVRVWDYEKKLIYQEVNIFIYFKNYKMHANDFINDLISGKENIKTLDFSKLTSVLRVRISDEIEGKIYYVGPVKDKHLQLMKENLWTATILEEITEDEFNKRFPPWDIDQFL